MAVKIYFVTQNSSPVTDNLFELFELEMYKIIVINLKSNSLLYLCIFDILKHRTDVEVQLVAYH